MDGRTDGRTDRPSQRDAFLRDASKTLNVFVSVCFSSCIHKLICFCPKRFHRVDFINVVIIVVVIAIVIVAVIANVAAVDVIVDGSFCADDDYHYVAVVVNHGSG